MGNPSGLPTAPLEQLLGASLDARLFTNLSQLFSSQSAQSALRPSTGSGRPELAEGRAPQSALVTPNDRFYVRTATTSRDRGAPQGLDLAALEPEAITAGPWVMECAGNADPANFGLLSAARWEGIPMPAILGRLGRQASGPRVLVTGTDDSGPSATSVPGAAWIFTRDQLEHAVLAVRMNGANLPPDHGAPSRLVVPGWYGCACVKWVDRIAFVADDAPATTQMREFASRTHQPFDSPEGLGSLRAGTALARDFTPAVIDTAAFPVRVEKWADAGRVEYRIVGVMWGGTQPTDALSIRFRTTGPWTRVDQCPKPASTLTWSVWTHTWRPSEPGRYQIVLRVDDASIRTRRLDLFYYVREVQIDEI